MLTGIAPSPAFHRGCCCAPALVVAQFPYALLTGMPPAPITDEERSLEAAGLLSAVIIQRK
jgi:hypothetical protein